MKVEDRDGNHVLKRKNGGKANRIRETRIRAKRQVGG